MESINTEISKLSINFNVNDYHPADPYYCFNFRELAKTVESIKKNYFLISEKLFKIDVFYFKRIYKYKINQNKMKKYRVKFKL